MTDAHTLSGWAADDKKLSAEDLKRAQMTCLAVRFKTEACSSDTADIDCDKLLELLKSVSTEQNGCKQRDSQPNPPGPRTPRPSQAQQQCEHLKTVHLVHPFREQGDYYACPVADCKKRYKSMSSLIRHLWEQKVPCIFCVALGNVHANGPLVPATAHSFDGDDGLQNALAENLAQQRGHIDAPLAPAPAQSFSAGVQYPPDAPEQETRSFEGGAGLQYPARLAQNTSPQ
ncbi:hypothetical protein AURDEDRAFT_166392 [Auricularia subglabra TFB-10046 SS5]|uniref:Uncharacterized protein n=1 Tax=Auricularia subglabra (strain TFB-10046 / SS5) TaxID=717982 RepID=J0D3C1_AURST|nr:hypothetical protein AURDEDRAFT_166392 [Auricularia subglabra TFB-10046 SS5]